MQFLTDHVVVGGADAGVAKPDRDDGGDDIGLQRCHPASVSQHVWMNRPTGQAWAARCGGLCVGREPESHGVPAEATSGAGLEERTVGNATAFG